MPTDPAFRMTVEDVFFVEGRGTIAVGKIESGRIRPGDAVEIHSARPGRAVIVDQIEAYHKVLQEAGPGETVGLVLGALGRGDLQRGDLLLAGEAGPFKAPLVFDHRKADKVPKRRKPAAGLRDFAPGIVEIVVLAGIVYVLFTKQIDLWFKILLYGIGLFMIFLYVRKIFLRIRDMLILKRESASAAARILFLRRVEHESEYGTNYTYHLTLEFTPTQTVTSPERLVLDAEVRRNFWEQQRAGQKINVRYATQNPHILLIEGE